MVLAAAAAALVLRKPLGQAGRWTRVVRVGMGEVQASDGSVRQVAQEAVRLLSPQTHVE